MSLTPSLPPSLPPERDTHAVGVEKCVTVPGNTDHFVFRFRDIGTTLK